MLPDLAEGERVAATELASAGHETRPPARYTEATLIRELEEREIGRPSTYASIIGTILNRGYVYKKGTALVPAWLAFAVVRLLERHFASLVDYNFTAAMEDVLDEVAAGRRDSVDELGRVLLRQRRPEGLKRLVTELGEIDARELSTFELGDGIALRVGRYGPYVEDADANRANVPEDLPPDELTLEKARELLANPAGVEHELGDDPDTGRRIIAKNGRYGPYVTEVLGDDPPKGAKARISSLFKTMSLETVTLDDALKLLSLPRVVGVDPESGEEITAQNGRYGPYLKKGTDSRSLQTEDQLLTITLDESLRIYAEPKQRGRAAARGAAARARPRPRVREGRHGSRRPVRSVRHRRRVQRDPSQGRRAPRRSRSSGPPSCSAEKRANGPAPKKRAAKKTAAKKTTKKTAKKTTEDGQEGGGQEVLIGAQRSCPHGRMRPSESDVCASGRGPVIAH